MKTRVAVLGAGHPLFERRWRALLSSPELQVGAVCDRDPAIAEGLAAQCGALRCKGREQLFEEPCDLLLLGAPSAENPTAALEAARAGRAMLIEPPGAARLEDLQQIAEALEAGGVFCQIGNPLRHASGVLRAREIVQQGCLGRITTARFHCALPAPALAAPGYGEGERGGLAFGEFCQVLDLLTLFFGAPLEALARFARFEDLPEHRFEDAAAVVVRFADALVAGDCCGWEAHGPGESWDLQLSGTMGSLAIGLGRSRLELFLRADHSPFSAGWSCWEEAHRDPLAEPRAELEEVARRVLVGQTPAGMDIDQALRLFGVLEKMYGEQGL